jgi:hypothetical protein
MDAFQIRGELTTSLFLPDGTFLCSENKENHITNLGIKAISRIITGLTPLTFGYIQIGTGGESYEQLKDTETGVPLVDINSNPIMGLVFKTIADAETGLYAYYSETADTGKLVDTGTYTISGDFQIPLDVAINEAGIFAGSHSGAPVMLSKQVFSNTVKQWQARRDSTLSTVTGTYIILAISWKVFFGRDPQYEAMYDPDRLIIAGA